MRKSAFLLTLAFLLPCGLQAAKPLEQQFQNPPEETKPYCYWYWYKSDITLDGITKDLEAMKKAGIRLAMIGNLDHGGQKSGTIPGVIPLGQKDAVSFAKSLWIWHPAEDGAASAPAGTKYFKKVFQADPATLEAAKLLVTADNSFVAWVNGKEVAKGADWNTPQEGSITPHLKNGENVLAVAVTNPVASPSGLVAALMLDAKDGTQQLIPSDTRSTEAEGWRENGATPVGWQAARVLGAVSMNPWRLSTSPTTPSFGPEVRLKPVLRGQFQLGSIHKISPWKHT